LIEALFRSAWPIIVFTMIIGVLAAYHSYRHLSLKTSRDELISIDQRLIQLSREVDQKWGRRLLDPGGAPHQLVGREASPKGYEDFHRRLCRAAGYSGSGYHSFEAAERHHLLLILTT